MTSGAVRFCRYAYAPNALGYCGPDDARAVLEHGAAGEAGPDLVHLARGFEGAWPYLDLIATANGLPDPLDRRVVEAYWVGNRLLDAVDTAGLGRFVEDRFKRRMGRRWAAVSDAPLERCVPHHNFHVFLVYPWVGMLRLGRTIEPLHVLDQCRIRWGTVERIEDDTVFVRSRPLVYEDERLQLGVPITETPVVAVDGLGFVAALRPGDRVSMHWGWLCERLTSREVAALTSNTVRALYAANAVLHDRAASVFG